MNERGARVQNQYGVTVLEKTEKHVFSPGPTDGYFWLPGLSTLCEWALRRLGVKGRRWHRLKAPGSYARENAANGSRDVCGDAEKLG